MDTRDARRQSLSGSFIAQGRLGALFEYRGDLKQFAEGLGLPHYATENMPCFFCKCNKHDSNRRFDHELRTHQDYLQAAFQQRRLVAVPPDKIQALQQSLLSSKKRLGVAIRRQSPIVAQLGLQVGDRLLAGGDLISGWLGGALSIA